MTREYNKNEDYDKVRTYLVIVTQIVEVQIAVAELVDKEN